MPTLTTIIGSFLGALAAGVGQEIAADLLKERTIDRWLDARINHDVQQALRRAFARAVEDLLKEYQAGRPWRELPLEQQTLVRERCALLQSPKIIAQLFPTVDDPRGELPDEDVARLFTADHETVNRELLAELDRLGLIEGLPADFQRRLRERLLKGITYYFFELGIKGEEKTRDAVFFQQLMALRGDAAAAQADLSRILAALDALPQVRDWQAEVLSRLEKLHEEHAEMLRLLYEERRPPPRPPAIPDQAPPPVAPFVGRERELADLARAIAFGRAVLLAGPPGVGKTALAIQAAHKLRERFPEGVVWVRLDVTPDPTAVLTGIAAAYGVTPDPRADLAGQVSTMLQSKQALLVLDGAEQAGDLAAILRCTGHCAVLITSRDRLAAPGAWPLDVLPLPPEEALALFVAHLGRELGDGERPLAEEICGMVGYLPLALRLAGSALRVWQTPLARYLERLRARPLEALHLKEAREWSVRVTFDLSYERLTREERAAFALAGEFGGADFDLAAAAGGLGVGQERAEPRLDRLVALSLLERAGERYAIHPLLKAYARQVKVRGRKRMRGRLADHYLAFAQAQDERGWEGYDALERELPNLRGGFDFVAAAETRDDGKVRDYTWAVQDMLRTRGYWDEAMRWLGECARACEQLGDRAGLARSYNIIGNLYHSRGNYGAALEWHRKALATWEQLDDQGGLARSYNNIGNALFVRDEYEAALERYKKSMEIWEQLGNQAGLATNYNNIGNVYYVHGDYGLALEWYKRSVEINERLEKLVKLPKSYINIGNVYYAWGDYEAALQWYHKALAICEQLSWRAVLTTCYDKIGEVYYARGNYEIALKWHCKALAICEQLDQQGALARSYKNIGRVYYARGEYETALEWCEKSARIYEQLGDRAGLATSYNDISEVHRARGEYKAALEWCEKSAKICEQLGRRAELARTYSNIGEVYCARGDYQAALEWYEKSLALCEQLGDRAGLAMTLHNMGYVALAQGDLATALARFTRSRDLYAAMGLEKKVAEEEEMLARVEELLQAEEGDVGQI
jgi:tetratricopeptide (TPR) repeat protein